MSKYQEALDRLAIHSIRSEDVEILQELVDRETPMKPKIEHWEFCGVCGNEVHVEYEVYCENYCDRCGQRIDWSDEE